MPSKIVSEMCSRAFLVLGMHRSGTSALSRTLNLIGLRQADDLLRPDDANPSGYWEPRQLVHFNDRLLQTFGRHWADPKPMPLEWSNGKQEASNVSDAAAILHDEFGEVGEVVIKDPRLSRVMPVWRDALLKCGAEPVCFIACRNPLEVHQSLHVRDNMSLEHALRLWLTYALEAEEGTRGLRRVVVHYDALLKDWHSTFRSALAATGLPDMEGIERNRHMVDAFIDSNQRHHRATTAILFDSSDVDSEIKDT